MAVNGGTDVLQAWRWYLATLRSYAHDIEVDMQKVCIICTGVVL